MDSAAAWQQLFETWPASRPRTGILVTHFAESIPFVAFMTSPGLIALERDRPDSLGGRKVILTLSAIAAVKLTDTEAFSQLTHIGFR